jgi:carbohydrate diacid regulator
MLTLAPDFSQIAHAITHQLAELLHAPVFVVDDRGMILTSSDPESVGKLFAAIETEMTYVRVPLQHEATIAEVVVGTHVQEPISPRLAQALVELVINQTTTQQHLPSQHELKNQLIADLLHDRLDNEAIAITRAKQLGIDLNPPRAVILIDATDYILWSHADYPASNPVQQCRAQNIIGSIVNFFHLPSDTICADLGQGKIAVLKASDSKNLDPWASRSDVSEGLGSSWANLAALKRAADALLLRLHTDTTASINIGIGRYHPGIRGLARSHEDAQAALSLGRRFQGANKVHCLGELGIAAFVGVSDERTKIDLAKYLLSPLDHEPELLLTLDAFFSENCCPSSAAKRLSIHRNTLSYRLDKIASLTDLEPRRFDDAVQMRVALLLRSLQSSYLS